jgi:superkiller protein 3
MRYDNHLLSLHAVLRRMVGGRSPLARPFVTIVLALCLTSLALGQSYPNQQRISPRAQWLIDEGNSYRNQGNYRAAIERYDQALRLAPDVPYAHLAKGWALQSLNEHERALISFAEAQRLGYGEPYLASWSIGESHLALNQPREAISALSYAARLKPDQAVIHAQLAGAYFLDKQYAEAKWTALRAIQLDGNHYYAHAVLGDANFNLKDYQGALSAYQRAALIQPNAAGIYSMIGSSRRQLRDFDAALEAFRKALRIDPKFADAHFGLAICYHKQGRYEEAVASAQRFVDLKPTDGAGYIGLSWYYSFLRRHEAAAQAGLKAIQYAPEEHMGYTNLCRALNDLGQYREALSRCQGALNLKPGDGETLFYLGRAHEALKNMAEAKRAFAGALTGMREYVRQNPNEEDGHYLLGNIYMSNGQPRLAIDAYRTAIRLQPRFPFAISNLGVTYLLVGDRQAALAQYRELLSIDPTEAGKLLRKIEPKKVGRR